MYDLSDFKKSDGCHQHQFQLLISVSVMWFLTTMLVQIKRTLNITAFTKIVDDQLYFLKM